MTEGVSTSFFSKPGKLLFPKMYLWLVLASAMDIILTYIILNIGGTEVNPVADMVIAHHGLSGMIGFKYAFILLVIIICDHVGRNKPGTGRFLAEFIAVVSMAPIIVAAMEFVRY